MCYNYSEPKQIKDPYLDGKGIDPVCWACGGYGVMFFDPTEISKVKESWPGIFDKESGHLKLK